MKLTKLLTYTFLILNLSVLQLLSEENSQSGTIKGRLIDNETKSPLVGANVEVLDTQMGAATDMDGYYIINNVYNIF